MDTTKRHDGTYERTPTMADANDILFGNNAPAMGFDPGTKIRGRITEQSAVQRRKAEMNSATKQVEQGEPLFWKDGKVTTEKTDRPVMDPVLTIQTSFTAWEGVSSQFAKIGKDDGLRRVFVKGRSKANPQSLMDAVITACKEAGVRKIQPGDFVEIVCTGEGKKANRGMNAPKLYEASYFEADRPPVWAPEIPTADDGSSESEPEDDNPFDQ